MTHSPLETRSPPLCQDDLSGGLLAFRTLRKFPLSIGQLYTIEKSTGVSVASLTMSANLIAA
jgi:hypothetical protein